MNECPLTPEQLREIRAIGAERDRLRAEVKRMSAVAVARRFGVSSSFIERVWLKNAWKEIG